MSRTTPSINPGPDFSSIKFLNHGVKKFIVQKSWLEKSRVGMSFSLLERWHFNPGHFNHKFLNCGVEKL
jgi:hypothetical protein